MGVRVVRNAVGGPTRVGDADMSGNVFARGEMFQVGDLALAFEDVEPAVPAHQRYAGAVVTPVFQPVESLYQNRIRVTLTYITYNPAHGLSFVD